MVKEQISAWFLPILTPIESASSGFSENNFVVKVFICFTASSIVRATWYSWLKVKNSISASVPYPVYPPLDFRMRPVPSSAAPMKKKLVYMTLTEAYYFLKKMKESQEAGSLSKNGVVHLHPKEKTNAGEASAEAA